MTLPSPIPDNPTKWTGWKLYNSSNPYERLCLSMDVAPTDEQIEENCRQLLMWWQKKLPLKNQPSNPLTQLLRAGLDEAPKYLAEARTELLNPFSRKQIDDRLREQMKKEALDEIRKFLHFAMADGILTDESENSLLQMADRKGLEKEIVLALINEELEKHGAKRFEPPPAPVAVPQSESVAEAPVRSVSGEPAVEFMRLLRLTNLDADEMTDDQRDALCNMGESLGLTGGQAEDVIDEYLEEMANKVVVQSVAVTTKVKPMAQPKSVGAPAVAAPKAAPKVTINVSPLARAEERRRFPNFSNCLGMEMILVPSWAFSMGSEASDAAPNESPVTPVIVGRFYMARYPVTNVEYEQFDPGHRSRRAPWADERHPVIYVNSLEAIRFCDWLSSREKRRYRLPTEAEWEYAAKGLDGNLYPWGKNPNDGTYANFADTNTSFAWKDSRINDGYPQTSPVGVFPKGISAFGIEEMGGNVWEWCSDFYASYKGGGEGKDIVNPRGPLNGNQKVYRGGSWKSRIGSLRTTARGYNVPAYSSNDVGFRIICECGE